MMGSSLVSTGKLSWPSAFTLVSLLSVCSVAAAGPLGDFEAEATKKKEEEWKHVTVKAPRPATYRKSDAQPENRCEDLFRCLFSDMLGGIFNAIFKGGSEVSLARALGRDPGDHDLPLVGGDINFQSISPQINAIDARAEFGYGPMALQFKGAHFSDKEYSESLNVVHAHGLFRISGNSAFQINLGFGGVLLNGKSTNSGISTTIPVAIFPRGAWGGRFVSTWSWIDGNRISDYDGSVEFARRFYSARIGYRTSLAGDQALSGPYLGFSFHY